MVRAVFKTVEAFARGLVGSIPTLSRHVSSLPHFMRVGLTKAANESEANVSRRSLKRNWRHFEPSRGAAEDARKRIWTARATVEARVAS